jgi:hypothetical protein
MYLIPILFPGLGAIRGHGSYIAIKKFHADLQEIGCALSPTGPPAGWERFRGSYNNNPEPTMKHPYCFSDDRPKLYYRATCARCRVISSVLIALSVVSFGAYRFR